MKKITGKQLGKLILKGLEAGGWGTIEPYLFNPEYWDDNDYDADALKDILENVAKELNKGQ